MAQPNTGGRGRQRSGYGAKNTWLKYTLQHVEFHLPHGDWIPLLRANGFEIENLLELQAPAGARTPYTYVTDDWAHRWPSEEVWVARKRA